MLVSVQPGCCYLWVGLVVPAASRPRADLWRRRSRLDWAMDSDHLRITVAHRLGLFFSFDEVVLRVWRGLGDFSTTVSLGLVEGFVDLAGAPEVMKKYGQLTCDRDDGSLLGIFAAARGDLGAEASQVRVRSKGTEDVVSGVDQQSPHT